MTELRTGEPGHVWDREPARKWPPLHRLLDGERQTLLRGPLACTECGVPWPGRAPCEGRP